jgi:hypothetical protein
VSLPEGTLPPDLYYDETEARNKFTEPWRIVHEMNYN